MTVVPRTGLHAILAGRTEWTDATWDAAVSFLRTHVSPAGVGAMYEMVLGTPSPLSATAGHLDEFRRLPPTVLLGFLDLLRWRDAVDEQVDSIVDESLAEATRRSWEAHRRDNGLPPTRAAL